MDKNQIDIKENYLFRRDHELLTILGLLLIPRMGVTGSIITFLVGYAIVALCGPVYAILFWKRMPRTMSEWVTIPAGFGAADDERLDASIHSLEEATAISSEVQRFCEERNVEQKKATYSALALEELCLGIIKDRFEADKKKHMIEVRVLHKGEDIFMSLKDDCKPYNPQERAEFVDPKDDSPKSISIRLFMGIVKETEYQLTLGINVFTVTV
jgi:anti-sigma regulatory factor (Ser/Thr protein kinase)